MSSRLSIVPAILFCLSNSALAGTWYVNGGAAAGGNGQTWGTAYQRVQDALAVAQLGDQVWVAQGTYLPGDATSPRSVTFQIPAVVALYGGFAGGETLLSQRDWVAHETILSGDLHQDDLPGFVNRSDNCYHAVSLAGAGPTTRLDGFTIRGGNADGSGTTAMGGGLHVASTSGSPVLTHLRFVDNRAVEGGGALGASAPLAITDSLFEGNHAGFGGGVYGSTSMDLMRCLLRSNDAATVGGACYFENFSTVNLSHCLLSGNSATIVGGFYAIYPTVFMRNCTLTANHATYTGGAGVDGFGAFYLYDSIVWGNTDTTHPGLYEQQLAPLSALADASAIQGGSPPWNLDPLWADPLGPDGIAGTADDDLRLSCLSPYIDAGANYLAGGGSLDLDGNARLVDDPAVPNTGIGGGPIVDLGAYEFSCGCSGAQNYCSALPNTSGGSASIGWSGSTSVYANSFTLLASGAPPLKNGLFFYGSAQANVPWGDGLRCVGGSLQRLALIQTDAGGAASHAFDFTLHSLAPGAVRNFQFYFRDPLGGPAGWNSSDALEVSFCP